MLAFFENKNTSHVDYLPNFVYVNCYFLARLERECSVLVHIISIFSGLTSLVINIYLSFNS